MIMIYNTMKRNKTKRNPKKLKGKRGNKERVTYFDWIEGERECPL
jgi:hypothetical protein